MGNSVLCPTSIADDESFDSRYEVDEGTCIGTGKFAVVRLCWLRDEPEVRFAMKVISRKDEDFAMLHRVQEEVNTLRILGAHPGIVSLIEVDESEVRSIRLVFELCDGGELYDRIEQKGLYSEHDAKVCCNNLLQGVAYIHSNGIMHRDLKPENILLVSRASDTDVKISDFGLAKAARDFPSKLPRSQSICGSDFYLAPEIIKQEEYGREVDVWALGVIAYVLLSGSLPFFHAELHKLYRQIVEREISFPDKPWKSVSKSAMDFILCLCCIKPADRLSAQAGLSHAWVTGGGGSRAGKAPASVHAAGVPSPVGTSFGSFASLVSTPGPAQLQAALHASQWGPGAAQPPPGGPLTPLAVSREHSIPPVTASPFPAMHGGPQQQRQGFYVVWS